MIGQLIESRPPFPLGSLILALGGLGLVVLSLASQVIHLAVLSVPLWVTAGLLLLSRPRRLVLELTETTLEVRSLGMSIPLQDIESLSASGRPANPFQKGRTHYPIDVGYPSGVLRIPARLNVPSDQVYLFLFQHLAREEARKGLREAPPLLQDYLKYQERRHGRERVHLYRGRKKSISRAPRGIWVMVQTMIATGLIWGVLALLFTGKRWEMAPWGAFGVVLIVFGAVIGIVAYVAQFMPRHRLHGSCVILCPDGLALIQGQLQGQLRWPELKKVKLRHASHWHFTLTRQPTGQGVLLQVEGATMFIADIYDRPVSVIYQQLCFYWRGEQGYESFEREARESELAQRTPPSSEGITPE